LRRDLLQSPTRPGRGPLRVSGDHRQRPLGGGRPGGRFGHEWAATTGSARRGNRSASWAEGVAGITVSQVSGGEVRLVLDASVDSDTVLRVGPECRARDRICLQAPPPFRTLPRGGCSEVHRHCARGGRSGGVRFGLHRRHQSNAPREVRTVPSRLNSDVGLIVTREVRERFRGRLIKITTLFILLVVAAAIVIPTLHNGKAKPQEVGIVGTLSSSLRATVTSSAKSADVTVASCPNPASRMPNPASIRVESTPRS